MFKKWSVKKKILAGVSLFLVLALTGGVGYYVFRPEPGVDVTLVRVTTGDLTQTLETTATVESANQGVYQVVDGTKIVEVRVRVGDRVKQGDLLATFDTSALKGLLDDKQKSYDAAKEALENFNSNASLSVEDAAKLEKDIARIQAEIKAIEDKKAAEDTTEKPSDENSNTTESLRKIVSGLFNGILTGGSSFDLSSIIGISGEDSKLTSLQFELMQLQLKQTLQTAQSSGALEGLYKSVYESAEKSLVSTKAAVEMLNNGWYAEYDGVVREVNIAEGQIYATETSVNTNIDIMSLISSLSSGSDVSKLITEFFNTSANGMVVEYFPFTASFLLGKYDVLKVSMDQPVKITSPKGNVSEGKVTFISPVASTSTDINISSLLGTSGSASGVVTKVSIPQPDESVIIGFDVDLQMDVGQAENALIVPAEAVQFDNEGSYVFVFNEDENTVTRTIVRTGIFSGKQYQIMSGCDEGDYIVKAPSISLADGVKVNVRGREDG